MIQVTINNQTSKITDLRQYSKILEIEYLKKDAALSVALKTIEELKTVLEPINKALKYKIKAEDNQNWKDDLKNKMRAEMALKGGTGK